jgi:hypothetical protein
MTSSLAYLLAGDAAESRFRRPVQAREKPISFDHPDEQIEEKRTLVRRGKLENARLSGEPWRTHPAIERLASFKSPNEPMHHRHRDKVNHPRPAGCASRPSAFKGK